MSESNLHKKEFAYKRNWYVCIKEIDLNCLDGVAAFFVCCAVPGIEKGGKINLNWTVISV